MTYTTTPVEDRLLDRAPAAQIEVDHVTKIYEPPATRRRRKEPSSSGTKAVDDVTFSVATGEVFVIMGLSSSSPTVRPPARSWRAEPVHRSAGSGRRPHPDPVRQVDRLADHLRQRVPELHAQQFG